MLKPFCNALLSLALFAAQGAALPRLPEAKPAGPTELHVVAVNEVDRKAANPTASVKVDRPGVEVTLVLSGYNPVTWDVTATPKTIIKKVILAGYHGQAANVPNGTEVVKYFHEGRDEKPYLYLHYKLDSPRFRPSVQAIHELTGQEIRSFQGVYSFKPAFPFLVDAIQDEPRLSSVYPTLSRAAEIPKVKFQAVHLVATGGHETAGSLGDFTQDGPVRATFKPLPGRLVRLVFDPKGKKHYGMTAHDIHEADLEKRTSVKLTPTPGTVNIGSLRAMAFDTKRERLLVVANRTICEYVPATGKWGAVAELPRLTELTGLAYHPKDDMLYGLGQEFAGSDDGGRPVLYQMSAQGAILKSTRMPAPMFPGVIGRIGFENRAQLISAGDHLAVLIGGAPSRDENGRPGKAESFLFLIDPATEKVTLAWKQ
ncbi:hypothetical protein [Zavarzinella formosa]|uniref:hypothetical protein n=1 Tax=Zavarzinella formosa TaxID=360055 RepID=UPI00035D5087|nr:hypothetical protein [Zavarzinella formosa]